MRLATRLVAVASIAAIATLGACSQQKPAEQAVAAAESALAAVSEDAIKYVPGEYKRVKAELDSARKAIKDGKYADALAAVQKVPAEASALAAHAAEAKARFDEKLKGDWQNLTSSVPGMVSSVEAKLTELGSLRKLPEGIDKPWIDDATAQLTSAKQAWTTAQERLAAGDIEQAIAHALVTQTLAKKLMVALGLAPPEPAPAESPAASH